jgi:periplasmic protein TonB
MKTIVHIVLLILSGSLVTKGQSPRFISYGKLKASTTVNNIQNSAYIHDLSPEFWDQLTIPFELKQEFEKKRLTASAQGYYVYPQDKDYSEYIKITGAKFDIIRGGKKETIQGKGQYLTQDIKQLLTTADLGTDIVIELSFPAPEVQTKDTLLQNITSARVRIHMVPEEEAEFPGGTKALTTYLAENILMKYPSGRESQQLSRSLVSFCVDESGVVTNVRMTVSSSNKKIDEHIENGIRKMPRWKPAVNNNKKIKQDITLSFMGDGC